jgi:hypothetical protein
MAEEWKLQRGVESCQKGVKFCKEVEAAARLMHAIASPKCGRKPNPEADTEP